MAHSYAFIQLRRDLRSSLPLTLLTLLVVAIVGLTALQLRGYRLLSVQTASMRPTLRPGDAIVVAPIRPHTIRPGEIISYRSPRDPQLIISHRLIRIDERTGWLTTAGDATQGHDPPFPPTLVAGQVTAVAPHLGSLLDAIRRPLGLFVAVDLPAATILIAEARRLACVYARPRYSVRLDP